MVDAPNPTVLAGFHRFDADDGFQYGSFEVFWLDEPADEAGWYWWPCFPGCLPDGEKVGPFQTSVAAFADANSGE